MPGFDNTLRFNGLPYADDEQAKEFLRTTTCIVGMSGSNGVHFAAPASLLSRLSAPIEDLVKSFVDGTHASVNLDVADEGSLYRFCQFVYTGTYDGFKKFENADRRDSIEGTAPPFAETSTESTNEPANTNLTKTELQPGLFGSSEITGAGGLFGAFGGQSQPPTSSGCFGTSGTTGGGGLFGGFRGQNQPPSSGYFGTSGATGGGGLFGAFGTLSQPPTTNGCFGTSEVSGGSGNSELFRSFEGNCILNGVKLPYSLLSCRNVLNEATTSKTRFKKRKLEQLIGSDDDFHLTFKSRAISIFLQNCDQMHLWPSSLDGRRQSPGNVLVGHAKMWHLAEKYAITTLMDVASSRFSHELARWVIDVSDFVKDLRRVVGYLYHSRNGDNALQLLIAQFAACIVEDVKELEGWTELLKDVPAFSYDLGHALVKVYWPKRGD